MLEIWLRWCLWDSTTFDIPLTKDQDTPEKVWVEETSLTKVLDPTFAGSNVRLFGDDDADDGRGPVNPIFFQQDLGKVTFQWAIFQSPACLR